MLIVWACWKNSTDRLGQCRDATNLQFEKNIVSAKHGKEKCSKMRYACTVIEKYLNNKQHERKGLKSSMWVISLNRMKLILRILSDWIKSQNSSICCMGRNKRIWKRRVENKVIFKEVLGKCKPEERSRKKKRV